MHLSKGAGAEAGCKLGEFQLLPQRRRRRGPPDTISWAHPLQMHTIMP